jgi:cytochrome o ubiquinol oxidase subunit III
MTKPHQTFSAEDRVLEDRVAFGFWVYLMSDCLLFAALFAVYAVLHNNTFGGPPAGALFNLGTAFTETLILLLSSFTIGLGTLFAYRQNKKATLLFLLITLVLGITFLSIELTDFVGLVTSGNGWQRSGFLSSFFGLVGTHGIHVTVGALWMITLLYSIVSKGLGPKNLRRLLCLSLFWHFLDIVWIFIFSIVYLMGAL